MDVLTLYKLPEGDAEVDVTAKARELIDEARQLFEAGPKEAKTTEARSVDASEALATSLMMAGRYREVQALGAATNELSEGLRDTIVWSFIAEGNQVVNKARSKSGSEADRLFVEAGEKYKAALAVKPNQQIALNNLGNVLQAQAQTKSGKKADRLFAEAGEKYKAALAIDPNMAMALNNWGNALIKNAYKKQGEERRQLLNLGEAKLNEALRRGFARALYNLACVAALQGDIETARRHLLAAKESKGLPDRAHVENDPDLASLRDERWFREFLQSFDDREPPRARPRGRGIRHAAR